MSVTTEKTVRALALENPAATRVFERLGIDYCCGGNQSLEPACHSANLPLDQVLDSIEMAVQTRRAAQKVHDRHRESLSDVVAHIDGTHHKYTREEIARLGSLLTPPPMHALATRRFTKLWRNSKWICANTFILKQRPVSASDRDGTDAVVDSKS